MAMALEVHSQMGVVEIKKVVLKPAWGIKKTPYHGDFVTSDYDASASLLTLWFHYAAEDAEVIITCGDGTVADVTLDMEANERLEIDFSECETGEYTVSVAANGEIQMAGTFSVHEL